MRIDNRTRAIASIVIVLVLIGGAIVLLSSAGEKEAPPRVLPSTFNQETLNVSPSPPGKARRKNAEVIVRITVFGKSCWQGEITQTLVKGCGSIEYLVQGPPTAAGTYSATISRTSPKPDTITLELLINGKLISTDTSNLGTGLVAVAGN